MLVQDMFWAWASFFYFVLLLAGFGGAAYCSWEALGPPPMKVNLGARLIRILVLKRVCFWYQIFGMGIKLCSEF